MNKLLEYYNRDELSADAWKNKYALKDENEEYVEETPREMHIRLSVGLSIAEERNARKGLIPEGLSKFGRELEGNGPYIDAVTIFNYLNKYKYIIPQGSIMSALGNKYKIQSLSNCFVIPSPVDSYGGIFKTDQQIAQIEKRRGGVGLSLDTLRYEGASVLNSAGSSNGAHNFMSRFSNTTREVAQNGRRGALMLLMSVKHPDIFKFVTKKKDRTQVTGANISVMLTDEFMQAVDSEDDIFICSFPTERKVHPDRVESFGYNKIFKVEEGLSVMKIHARELFNLIVENAWENAEPGVAFIDRVINYSPDGIYEQYKPIAANPCGEQWLQAYDACRLIALNYFSIVVNPYQSDAYIDYDKLYEIAYIQQRLADDIVDLEIEYVDRIIEKIQRDPEDELTKAVELDLWMNIKKTAQASRRTGCGFTALADMLAALGLKYDSDEAIKVIEVVSKKKMEAELDCTIDLAILRGTFEGWDRNLEFTNNLLEGRQGKNSFYNMLLEEFPEKVKRMWKYGRRNVSFSTVAPTGTVSLVAILNKYSSTSGGIEPHFALYFFRNRKVNPSDKTVRVDFVDQNGDSWQTYPVVMGGLKEWYEVRFNQDDNGLQNNLENYSKEEIEQVFKDSPYFGSTAEDISWEKRIEIQSIVQKYTTNAISSTINLSKDTTKEVVGGIYKAAWKAGLKGVTVYRDGSRTGILVKEENKKFFDYKDALKRPKSIDAELYPVTVQGKKYAVVVGLMDDKPYEVFAFENDTEIKRSIKGKVVKVKKGHYNFINGEEEHKIEELQIKAGTGEEQTLTRLVSGMLRHGANPKFVSQQIERSELSVVSFGKAISRILNKYVKEDKVEIGCPECGGKLIRQEGCIKCSSCSYSRC